LVADGFTDQLGVCGAAEDLEEASFDAVFVEDRTGPCPDPVGLGRDADVGDGQVHRQAPITYCRVWWRRR